jgi:hypothetical protein
MSKSIRHNVERRGIILLLTIVVLVILSTLLYTVSLRISQRKRDIQYMVDYQKAKYGCDSAVRYSLAALKDMDIEYVDREGLLDFSDVFVWDREYYDYRVTYWAEEMADNMDLSIDELEAMEAQGRSDSGSEITSLTRGSDDEDGGFFGNLLSGLFGGDDEGGSGFGGGYGSGYNTDPNTLRTEYFTIINGVVDVNSVVIPGPYGPKWPLVADPIEVQIEDAEVTIRIEDENAKLPLVWALRDDEEQRKLSAYSLEILGEWLDMSRAETEYLIEDLDRLREIKEFSFSPAKTVSFEKEVKQDVRRRSRRRSRRTRRTVTKKVKQVRPEERHKTDFARLLRSHLVERESLMEKLDYRSDQDDRGIDFVSIWGGDKVNVNTAPRNVLEAVMAYGGSPENVALAIMEERHKEPFKDFEDLRDRLFSYSYQLDKVKDYVTCQSSYFKVDIQVVSGTASINTALTVKKNGEKVEKVAVMSY